MSQPPTGKTVRVKRLQSYQQKSSPQVMRTKLNMILGHL